MCWTLTGTVCKDARQACHTRGWRQEGNAAVHEQHVLVQLSRQTCS